MKIVGLTGGIGSGKSTLAKWFIQEGIPVYNSDYEAKKLLNTHPEIIEDIKSKFGEEAYINGNYNSSYIASKVFKDKDLLSELNQIVHPIVFGHFRNWRENQNSNFVVKEAAILFESGSYKDCDAIISVVAEESIRIDRVKFRDGYDESHIKERMKNQWTDEQRVERSDFVVPNNGDLEDLKEEFNKVYKKLLKLYKSS